MIRRIIQIDQNACNGCGLCATACHEGAIGMVDGKARLLREDYCDGLGDCLPACPAGAITFVLREAPAYDETAVLAAKQAQATPAAHVPGPLRNWPVQIRLAPVQSPQFQDADLLLAADCTPFAYGSFHRDFLAGRVALVGCPKLDGGNTSQKLREIFANNDIRSITVTRMSVPCCGGLPFAVQQALDQCGKQIPLRIVTITPEGDLI